MQEKGEGETIGLRGQPSLLWDAGCLGLSGQPSAMQWKNPSIRS